MIMRRTGTFIFIPIKKKKKKKKKTKKLVLNENTICSYCVMVLKILRILNMFTCLNVLHQKVKILH